MQPEFRNDRHPAGVLNSLDLAAYRLVVEVFERSCKKLTDHPAFSNLGVTSSHTELDYLFVAFAAYLQKQTNLQPGDRIAVQMFNILQYPIVVFGTLRAGLVAVNTNPLYTVREVRHQSKDADVRALAYLNAFGKLVEEVLSGTRTEYLIGVCMGDLLPALRGWLVNSVMKSVKKTVPDYRLLQAPPFRQALKQSQGHALQPIRVGLKDVAVLQCTGGTAGVSKGAMFTHGNLVANMPQVHAQSSQLGKDGLLLMKEAREVMTASLPLYHIYTFTANCMCMMVNGNHNVPVANPCGTPGFIKELEKRRFSTLLGLSTLFVALMEYPGSKDVDFPNLKLTNSGGTALVSATAECWKGVTGCTVMEGYGLTEYSPVVTTNPYGEQARLGTVEIPVVGTAFKVIDEQGNELPVGERGELCVKGPQVMKGYWQCPEATEETLDVKGWLKTGDIMVIDEDDFVRIVDRKKDLILVSGFNIYSSEIEGVVMAHPKVVSCAAVGILDEKSGEMVRLFAVVRDPSLSVGELKVYCKENLTGYKIP